MMSTRRAFIAIVILFAAQATQFGRATPQAAADDVRRVTPAQVRELLNGGKALLVDVRGEGSYKAGHIKGAVWIPLADIRSRAKELPKKKTIIAYCS